MSNDPSALTPAVQAMQEDLAIVGALMGGTKEMRKQSTRLLPKWPKEDKESYDTRLKASTLLPAYSETVQNMTGRVFAEPIVIGDDTPTEIVTYLENIDQQGNNLQAWAHGVFAGGLADGLRHVLVEFPPTVDKDGKQLVKTRADEINTGVRPYAVVIEQSQVLGWKSKTENGKVMLTQFRYMECVEAEDPDNAFLTKMVKQVRLLEPGYWATYRERQGSSGAEWVLNDEGLTSLDKIPLATFYTKRTGFLTATPPLMELAHLNVKHWQSQSDQDNLLHYARVPLLVRIGVDTSYDAQGNPATPQIQVGGTLTDLPVGADMKFVEHSGKALEAGKTSLDDLVDDMRLAGAKLLQKEKQATKTATQAEEEAAQEMSPLESMAGQFEDFLDQVLQFFADWMKADEGGHVQVNGNFDIDYNTAVTLPVLVNMAAQGRLSDETLFAEVKRRGVLNPDLDWAEEKQRIADQGPALGVL